MAIAAAQWRADGDEHGIGIADAAGLHGEFEPALLDVRGNKINEAGLEDRDFSPSQRRDPTGILVDASHMMTEIGKQAPETRPTYRAPIMVTRIKVSASAHGSAPPGGAEVPSNASIGAAGALCARLRISESHRRPNSASTTAP